MANDLNMLGTVVIYVLLSFNLGRHLEIILFPYPSSFVINYAVKPISRRSA